LVLKEAVNWDIDNVGEPMSSWDYVSNYFTNPTTIQVLFFLKRLPWIGGIARQSLFNHIFFVYDVVLNYLNAHDEIEKIASTVTFFESLFILKNFLFSSLFLKTSFQPSPAKVKKTKLWPKAISTITSISVSLRSTNPFKSKELPLLSLTFRKVTFSFEIFLIFFIGTIQGHYKQGQLVDKEYQTLMTNIDNSLGELAENYGSWVDFFIS